MDKVEVKFKRLNKKYDEIPLPSYSTEGSAGMDIRAAMDESITLSNGEIKLVPTNLSVAIPEGYEIQVRPRSGLAVKHGIGVLNSPGTIDSDYRGEIKIILINLGDKNFTIKPGDRIAQIVLSKFYKIKITETDLLEESLRGKGGFGHTGKN